VQLIGSPPAQTASSENIDVLSGGPALVYTELGREKVVPEKDAARASKRLLAALTEVSAWLSGERRPCRDLTWVLSSQDGKCVIGWAIDGCIGRPRPWQSFLQRVSKCGCMDAFPGDSFTEPTGAASNSILLLFFLLLLVVLHLQMLLAMQSSLKCFLLCSSKSAS